MIFKAYSVHDYKTNFFHQLMFFRNKGEAIRAFIAIASDSNSLICKYPSDFCLHEVGTWDDENCKFESYDKLQAIGFASEFLAKPVDVSQE